MLIAPRAEPRKRRRAVSGSVATSPVANGPRRSAGTLAPNMMVVLRQPILSETGPHAKRPPMFAAATIEGKPAATTAVDGPSAAPKMSLIINFPSWINGRPAMQTPTLPAKRRYMLGVYIAPESEISNGAAASFGASGVVGFVGSVEGVVSGAGGWYTLVAGRR